MPLLLPGNGDVPKSIVEAGELYSERMRVTSATAQMWLEKDKFQGYVKGFGDEEEDVEDELLDASTAEKASVILQRVEDTYVWFPMVFEGVLTAFFLERFIAAFAGNGGYAVATFVGEFYG